MPFKDKIFVAITFFHIVYIIFPLFADITRIPVFVPALASTFIILFTYPNAFWGKSTKWFVAYIAVLLLYILLGKPIFINGINQSLSPMYRLTIESAWILPNISIMNVLFYKNDSRLFKIIGYGSIALLLFSFLYILPLVTSTANILRDDIQSLETIRPIGLPDYTLMHAYTLMILPMCLLIRKIHGIMKYLCLGALLLFAYMITQTAVTTSLVVMFVAVLFAYLFDVRNLLRSFLILVCALIIGNMFSQMGYFIHLVERLMPYFEGTAVAFKLEDIHTSLLEGQVTGASLTGRMDYHQISREAFYYNPFFGSNLAGGHSKILDILGSMGLFAFIPYLMILYSSLKQYEALLMEKIELKYFLYISFFLAGIYLYTKGLFGSPGYLFTLVIVPSIFMSVYSLNEESQWENEY